jgi:hypothetical protein
VTITDANGCQKVLQVTVESETGMAQPTGSPFVVYPNPSDGLFMIAGTESIRYLRVTNILGQLVYESTHPAGHISLEAHAPGIYFLSIETEAAHHLLKLELLD